MSHPVHRPIHCPMGACNYPEGDCQGSCLKLPQMPLPQHARRPDPCDTVAAICMEALLLLAVGAVLVALLVEVMP